ncbi:MAG: hypothetical protein K2Q01_02385 [Rickettsiales bacterium]|nr:hypothetical protein [Rickettsiales bacterium]
MTGKPPPQGVFHDMLSVANNEGKFSATQMLLAWNEGDRKGISELLSEKGFRHFTYLGNGANSLAMHTVDGQVVRVFNKQPKVADRPVHPAVLQPIEVYNFKGARDTYVIEVLPYVRTDMFNLADADKVYKALAGNGILVSDTWRPGNVGHIEVKKGQFIPVLVDPGTAMYANSYEAKKDITAHLQPWLAGDGTWLQRQVEKRRAPSGVIVGEELRAVERATGQHEGRTDGQTARAIREDGFYRKQVEDMYARAVLKLEKDPTRSFSELLKEEREAIQTERLRT